MIPKILIHAEASSLDPRVCAFVVDRDIVDGSALCRNQEEATGSPLFEKLFALPGVVQVWATGRRITVARNTPTDWADFSRQVGPAIRSALSLQVPPVAQERARPSQGNLVDRVRQFLQSEINPGLAQHGGQAELVDVVDGIAQVRLSGGCQGCGAAQMTLSYGIEKTLLAKIPELKGVRDITDHARGQNPFYNPQETGQSPFHSPSRVE